MIDVNMWVNNIPSYHKFMQFKSIQGKPKC